MVTPRRITRIIFVGALLFASFLMLRLTLPYTAMRPGIDFLKTKVEVYFFAPWRWSFYTHVFTGLAALVAGFTQFSGYIIRHMKRLHRYMGYAYLLNVLFVTGPAALIMAFYANGGLPARASFVLQAICWLLFTAIAWRRIMQRRFISHGNWMLRSYALTFAAISLRTYGAILSYSSVDMSPVDKYRLIAWASWIPNLIIAEVLIRKGFIKGVLKGRVASSAA